MDNAPDSLATKRLAIIGLGLMGGSLALDLHGHVETLLAVDPDPATRALALELRIADRVYGDSSEILPQADIIILACPVRAIIEQIQQLADQARMSELSGNPLPPGKVILLDLGSTKQDVMDAMRSLPLAFDPLGGHPMCGKETSGLEKAEPGLFREATFVFTAMEHTSPKARKIAGSLAAAVGASPTWMDASTHDRLVAFTSHLPYLLANALAATVPGEARPLVGPGYRSTGRLASAPQTVMLDILQTNRENVLQALRSCRYQLDLIEKCLSGGDFNRLGDILAEGALKHQSSINQR